MPHVAFKCPDPAMWRIDASMLLDDTVPVADCLNCSLTRQDRECDWEYNDLLARWEDNGNYSGGLFTPSRFNGCDREYWLRQRNNYWTDPKAQSARTRGTRVHAETETSVEGIISEVRVYRTLEGITLPDGSPVVVSAQPDKVYPALGVIADTKTWGYLPRGGEGYKPGQIHPPEINDAYRLQLSVGAWCWANPKPTPGDPLPDPIEITEGQLTFRDSNGQIRIRGIELFPFDALEDYMRGRAAELIEVQYGTTEPGYCAEERRKFCATCPVLYLCGIPRELYAKPRKDTNGRTRKRRS